MGFSLGSPAPRTATPTQQVLSKHLLNGWVNEWTQDALRLCRTGQDAASPEGAQGSEGRLPWRAAAPAQRPDETLSCPPGVSAMAITSAVHPMCIALPPAGRCTSTACNCTHVTTHVPRRRQPAQSPVKSPE